MTFYCLHVQSRLAPNQNDQRRIPETLHPELDYNSSAARAENRVNRRASGQFS